MSGIVSIELLLDPESEELVRVEWERLAAAGLSSAGRHTCPSNRPHVTLLVRPALSPTRFEAALAALPIALMLAEPIVFRHGDRGVLARRIVPTEELLSFHRAVHAAALPGDDAAHTKPGEWTPHVTLARRLRLDALDQALWLVGPPHAGTGIALRRWDSATREVTPIG
ncbi:MULTISPECIES: 2'-5' RNA ligase family protein [Microbacterium]|uniref:2'-5' RNA ligase superfamily protein n=1 Tax=Microbacterium saccharophilum TaxID=1213358 RepID=A0A7Z7GDP7_9MICO|nr:MULTISPECIES: 2'-5' RNA ligase family protein [Microbacterium]SFI20240.1 2'-5' RNA ligase superfamily protein [Microbacterium saccharophilum]